MSHNVAPEYKKANNTHGCCISSGDFDFHQRCACSLPLSDCLSFCNQDEDCTGYVKWGSTCEIATTSNCPSVCLPYNVGNKGELTVNGACGKEYGGCYIKEEGR